MNALSADRQRFREALSGLASKTLAKIPTLNGRVERAVKLVLSGDVELHDDQTALVNSLTDPAKAYQLKDGVCQCRDWQHAPRNLCAHRLAVGFTRKLAERVPQSSTVETGALPEAPSSVNFRAMVGQFEMQFTLRDASEAVLLERLEALLRHKEIRPLPPKPAPRPQGQWKKPYQGRS